MRYETSIRINSDCTINELIDELFDQFRKVAEKVVRSTRSVEVKGIEATFGSINRADKTIITARRTGSTWIVVADVNYRPSVAFWVFAILGLPLLSLVPIGFYLIQRVTVKSAIDNCMARARDELTAPRNYEGSPTYSIADLDRLARLLERGHITDAEFRAKKREILSSPNRTRKADHDGTLIDEEYLDDDA